jgi:hypothetical protein
LKGIATVFCALLLACTLALAESPKGPRISIQDPYATYGKEVMEGDIVMHEFTFLNEGNETLQIKAVRPG